MGPVYQCWWRICREIKVFTSFEYHMFYISYPFMIYLLTLPHSWKSTVITGVQNVLYETHCTCQHVSSWTTQFKDAGEVAESLTGIHIEQLLYPEHLWVQGLMPADFPVQQNFCHRFCSTKCEHFFATSVLFIYDAHCSRNGIINIHNQHLWAEENPHGVIYSRHQQQFSINMWEVTVLMIVW
jgi:hypothetical protein